MAKNKNMAPTAPDTAKASIVWQPGVEHEAISAVYDFTGLGLCAHVKTIYGYWHCPPGHTIAPKDDGWVILDPGGKQVGPND